MLKAKRLKGVSSFRYCDRNSQIIAALQAWDAAHDEVSGPSHVRGMLPTYVRRALHAA